MSEPIEMKECEQCGATMVRTPNHRQLQWDVKRFCGEVCRRRWNYRHPDAGPPPLVIGRREDFPSEDEIAARIGEAKQQIYARAIAAGAVFTGSLD